MRAHVLRALAARGTGESSACRIRTPKATASAPLASPGTTPRKHGSADRRADHDREDEHGREERLKPTERIAAPSLIHHPGEADERRRRRHGHGEKKKIEGGGRVAE